MNQRSMFYGWILLSLWMLSFVTSAFSQEFVQNPIIGTVNGKAVSAEDVWNQKIREAMQQLHDQLKSEFMQHAVDTLSKEKPKLIKPFQKQPISQAAIKNFYEQNNLSQRGTLEKLTDAIRGHLEKQQQSQYYKLQYAIALSRGLVKEHLKEPNELLVSASVATAPFIRGNEKASVMVLEFSDYQCPYCGRIQATLDTLIEKYEKKVAFGYRHFPLPFHKEADEAAIAAECAGDQGKYLEMHQLLYTKQREQHIDHLKAYARQIKVGSPKQFDRCLDSEKYRSRVDKDLKEGAALGISGTPGFVIGHYDPKTKTVTGEVMSGALPQSEFEKLIEKYLRK